MLSSLTRHPTQFAGVRARPVNFDSTDNNHRAVFQTSLLYSDPIAMTATVTMTLTATATTIETAEITLTFQIACFAISCATKCPYCSDQPLNLHDCLTVRNSGCT